MDLGISGRTAIVCASSRGLGLGCAEALAAAGVNLVMNARNGDVLEAAAADIAERFDVNVLAVAADITTEEGREAVLATCPSPDILVNNAGGPPPGMWHDWEREDFLRAIEGNMLAPIAMMKATLPGMIAQKWGRVVNITSAAVKSPIGTLGLSNTARAGLTGFVAGTSRQVAGDGVLINNLLPGIHATDRAVSLDEGVSRNRNISVEQAMAERKSGIPTNSYGDPKDFGAMCAFLCSEKARFIVGQNILIDGGAFNSTM